MTFHLLHGRAVPFRQGNHKHAVKVFGRGAQHAGAANVNFFHRLFKGKTALHSTGKIIKVDADQIKGPNALFGQGFHVQWVVFVGKDAGMNLGMQSLDATAENFRKACYRANRSYWQALGFKHPLGAPGGNQFYAVAGEKGGKVGKAALVGYTQNGTPNMQKIHLGILHADEVEAKPSPKTIASQRHCLPLAAALAMLAQGGRMIIKLVSWNVNGLRAMIAKPDWSWFHDTDAQVVGLQEVKAKPDQLPQDVRDPAGWEAWWDPATVRKGYSGVGVYSKLKPLAVEKELPDPRWQGEGRLLHLEFPWFHYFTCYFPNGGAEILDAEGRPAGGFKRLDYKMGFMEAFADYAQKCRKTRPIVVCGDFNIACEAIDLARPKENEKNTGFLPVERNFMKHFKDLGYVDTFRHVHGDEPGQYTWWSYKAHARPRNVGWRLDYFFVSEELAANIEDAWIASQVYGSDHCPVGLALRVSGS